VGAGFARIRLVAADAPVVVRSGDAGNIAQLGFLSTRRHADGAPRPVSPPAKRKRVLTPVPNRYRVGGGMRSDSRKHAGAGLSGRAWNRDVPPGRARGRRRLAAEHQRGGGRKRTDGQPSPTYLPALLHGAKI
jgi:hypothetical protein